MPLNRSAQGKFRESLRRMPKPDTDRKPRHRRPSLDTVISDAQTAHGGPPTGDQTYIYFMQGIDGGPIKIGMAIKPGDRLVDLQCGSPVQLTITRLIIGSPVVERRLHRTFNALRLHGEWFQPHPALAAVADAQADESLTDINLNPASPEPDPSLGWHHTHGQALKGDSAEYATLLRQQDARMFEEKLRTLPETLNQHYRTLTYRPEPEDLGWKNSSADVIDIDPSDDSLPL